MKLCYSARVIVSLLYHWCYCMSTRSNAGKANVVRALNPLYTASCIALCWGYCQSPSITL